MVFQDRALYSYLSVYGNLAFVLRGDPEHDVRRRVGRVAEALGLWAVLDRKPGSLSGGQRRRVAFVAGFIGSLPVYFPLL